MLSSCMQMLEAVASLNKQGMLYNDAKLQNFLAVHTQEGPGVLLGDLGGSGCMDVNGNCHVKQ
jgi:hypothetical protein